MNVVAAVLCSKLPLIGAQIDLKGVVSRLVCERFPCRLRKGGSTYYLVCIFSDVSTVTESELTVTGPNYQEKTFSISSVGPHDAFVQITDLGELILDCPGRYELRVSADEASSSVFINAAVHDEFQAAV